MDPITHALLGATLAQAFFHKRLGKSAPWIGGLTAMAPDLDIFIRQSSQPLLNLIYHRQFTHALAFVPIGALICTLIWIFIIRRNKTEWPYVYLATFIAYLSHGLLDACTTYGTQLLWPWSDTRIAWDIIFIVDPIFTGILLLGVILTYKKWNPNIAKSALFLVAAYLGFALYQHHQAIKLQLNLASERQQQISQNRVYPLLPYLFGYRSLYISDQRIYLDNFYFNLREQGQIVPGISKPLFTQQDLPTSIKNEKNLYQNFIVYQWFTDGYISETSKNPLVLADMRYISQLKPFKALWSLAIDIHSSAKPKIYLIG